MRRAFRPALLPAVAILLCPGPASGDTARTCLQHLEDGTRTVEEVLTCSAGPSLAEQLSRQGEGAEVLWSRHHADAIYLTTALSRLDGIIAAGTYLNPPKQVEVVPIVGDGTPDWTYPGTELYVDASQDGSVIAGVDADPNSLTVTVYCWEPGSSVPLWSTAISPASRGSYRTVEVSADGSTIAVLVSMQEGSPAARLYLFSPASSTPIGVFDGPAGFARNLSLGADGRFAAFIGLATAYVADRDTGIIRWSGSMGATNDPIAISTDGRYLAFGWTSLRLLEWDGSIYAPLWSVAGGAYSLKTCMFSADGSTFVAGWYKSTYDQNRIQTFVMPSSTPLWTYLYALSEGAYQDIPSDIALTEGGEYILIGSWGDQLGINDEVHLFDGGEGTPLASLDTSGSIFDVDLAWDESRGGLYLTACGKTIHANQNGRGGDLYSLHYRDPASVADQPGFPAPLRIAELPNPFAPGDRISLSLDRSSHVDASILSADGRAIRTLARASFPEGLRELAWDGLDDAGRPVASGLYFVRIVGDRGRAVGRTVLLR